MGIGLTVVILNMIDAESGFYNDLPSRHLALRRHAGNPGHRSCYHNVRPAIQSPFGTRKGRIPSSDRLG